MKRAWTKKVKSLPSGAIAGDALERQLQPYPKVKVRIFRTSAAMIGLTVSIGTPNLLLTQAAPVPEGVSSANPIKDSAALETIQNPPIIAHYQVIPVEEITPQQAIVLPSYERSTERRVVAKKVAAPSYERTTPVIKPSTAEPSFSPQLQPSSQIAAQAPVVKPDVRELLRQHKQTISLEQVQAVAPPVAAATPSPTSRLIARLKANKKIEISRERAIEIAPNQNEADSRTLAAQPEVAVNPDANSAWTAKQRLLVERLKTSQNPAPLNNENAAQVFSNPELGQSTTATSQPTGELSAPSVVVSTPEQAPTVAATSENREFAAQPLADTTVVPTTETKVGEEEKLATFSQESAQPSPATTLTPESSTQLQPVFVLPEASVALEQEVAPPTEVEKVDEQQVASQNTPAADEVVENTTPAPEVVTSVNEPIIVSSLTTTEYQVKPGDTLTTIATAHRLSLPEITNFNHLPNPDLLLVDQRLKIPALTSMKTQANVAVLPPIEKVEPQIEANSLTAPALQPVNKVALISTEQKLVQTLPASAYTGVGGSVSEAEAEVKPLEKTALNELQSQYAQNLQNDVQKLQHKYYAQNPTPSSTVSAPVKSDRPVPATIKPSLNSGDEPINPDFRVAQTSQDLKPVPQKRLLNKVKYPVPATVRGRVATAPINADNSTEFATQQVTPELPPLAPALNYLPQPNNVPFNGYIWPARGALTSKYGWRWGRMHRGIDIAAPVGTPIFAAAPGVVIKSGWNKGGYGNLVDIQHADGTLTRYAHNYRLLVQPGQFVEQGQQISLMGNTGRSTGPHLHFEVHPGGKGAVNPIALLPKVR